MLFVRIIYSLFIIPLSFVVPKKNNSYLFGSGKGSLFKGNPKYLYLYMIGNKAPCEINWITADENIYYKLNKSGLPIIKLFSFKGFWGILRSKYLVAEMTSRDVYYISRFWGNFNLIQTWHGTPLKKIWSHMAKDKKGIMRSKLLLKVVPFEILKKYRVFSSCRYKLIISPSREVSNVLVSASLNKNVKITGYPRNDVFFNENLIFENYNKKFNFNTYKKIIFYCPTFRDKYDAVKPFSDNFLRRLNLYLKENNYLFLVKKHPYERKIDIPDNLSNVIDISGKVEEIQELLIYTDILITDYSSVFFDFVLLDRPIIYYSYDYDKYLKECRGMYYDYYKEIPGPFAKREEDLIGLIKNANVWFNDKKYQLQYKKFRDKFNYYQDGKSCERLLKAIKNLN